MDLPSGAITGGTRHRARPARRGWPRRALSALIVGLLLAAPPAAAQDSGSSPIGDLAGNWPWTVWLLIPLAIGLGLITALALGTATEAGTTNRRRSVSRALDRREVARQID